MKTGIKNSLLALGFFGILTSTFGAASAAYFDNAPAFRCDVQITRQLSTGSEGTEVTVLQNFLNRAGYLSATPNGHFGPATRSAVQAFQSTNFIPATGTVGPATRNAINERMCDTDLRGDSLTYFGDYSSAYSGYSSGVTYVDPYDPFVQVITPPVVAAPTIYTNPQTVIMPPAYNTSGSTVSTGNVINHAVSFAPATNNTSIASTNIIYAPGVGYTYGITPAAGSLTVTSPVASAVYNEGDTVTISWRTSNLNANGFNILLENSSTGQSKTVTSTTGNNASFVLTKEVLDAVCSGACNNNNQGSFRIVVTTPIRDIAGAVSTFRAAVSPITIRRPVANFGTVSITTNKNPVTSGEIFKLYVNIPTGASWNTNLYGQYAFKIRAICGAGVTATIAGTPCGQDFSIPFAPTYFQSEIPASVANTSWYQQNVTFVLTVTNLAGQTIGTSETRVTVSAAPFSW